MTEVTLQILIDNVDSENPIRFVRNDSRPPRMIEFFCFIDLCMKGSERYVDCCHQDPLDGGNFWFTHRCGFPVEMVLGYEVVELPFQRDFQIDSFAIWQRHGTTDVLLIESMFRSAVKHLVANGLISCESDLHARPIDEQFAFFAHDLTPEGLQRVRHGYRRWTERAFIGGTFDTVDW